VPVSCHYTDSIAGNAIDSEDGMANRNWQVGVLALMASSLLAGCLPQAKAPTTQRQDANTANTAPVISGSPSTSATAGIAWQFQPSASDADGDALTFTAAGLPAWASIDRQSGRLSGTPGAGDVGATSSIVVSVSDGDSSASLAAFSIVVASAATVSAATGTAALSWTAPTAYTDGSALSSSELTAYRIYHGASASSLTRIAEVDGRAGAFTVNGLVAGTHHFAVTAVSLTGVESDFSSVGTKTIL
jgi:hypothetical protein